MTDWFARPVLHVKDVEASSSLLREPVGFTPWRYDEDGKRTSHRSRGGPRASPRRRVAGEDRQGAMFIPLNAELETQVSSRSDACAQNYRPRAFRSRMVRGLPASGRSMIPTAISSSSTIRPRLHPARLLETEAYSSGLAEIADNGGGMASHFHEVCETVAHIIAKARSSEWNLQADFRKVARFQQERVLRRV